MNHRWVLLGLSALAGGALASDSRLIALTQGKQDTGRTIKLEKTVSCSPARTYAMWATDEGVRAFFAPASRAWTQVLDGLAASCAREKLASR